MIDPILHHFHKQMKLGKSKAKPADDKRLKMAKYITPALPSAPPSLSWYGGRQQWGMMHNDTVGDCVIAAKGHAIQVWEDNVSFPEDSSTSDDEILKYYKWWTGYNPADPLTDQGADMVAVMKQWRASNLAGHHLIGFADPNINDQKEIEQCVAIFGGVDIGLAMPITALGQQVWDVVGDPNDIESPSAPGSWGGHDVFAADYNPDMLVCLTWGARQKMTWRFLRTYCDELHVMFGGMWVEKRKAPSGFMWDQLLADLALIGNIAQK